MVRDIYHHHTISDGKFTHTHTRTHTTLLLRGTFFEAYLLDPSLLGAAAAAGPIPPTDPLGSSLSLSRVLCQNIADTISFFCDRTKGAVAEDGGGEPMGCQESRPLENELDKAADR